MGLGLGLGLSRFGLIYQTHVWFWICLSIGFDEQANEIQTVH